jgi:hypothetical protein
MCRPESTFLGTFITSHLPRKDHDAFRHAVLGKLTAGQPGGGAFRRAVTLAAIEFGFSTERLEACGLPLTYEKSKTRPRNDV